MRRKHRTPVTLTLTVTVFGTTAEDLLQHVECIEEEIAGLFEENIDQCATLESYTVPGFLSYRSLAKEVK